jgi:putative phosphoesterase
VIVGVLSDTHDRLLETRLAVRLLLQHGAEALIHCGDLMTENVLDCLAGPVPAYFVFGNNDFDRDALQRYAKDIGLHCLGTHGRITLGGKVLGIAHGDRLRPIQELLAEPDLRYLISGHTHVAEDRQEGTVRWVNPGALHRTRSKSVCTIDLSIDAVRFHLL